MTCLSILANEPHLDATITSEHFQQVQIFNCGPFIIDASLVLEDFFVRSRISSII